MLGVLERLLMGRMVPFIPLYVTGTEKKLEMQMVTQMGKYYVSNCRQASNISFFSDILAAGHARRMCGTFCGHKPIPKAKGQVI